MKKILLNLLKENGVYSLTRIMAVVCLFSFLLVSFYLVLTNHTWGNYGEFSVFCGGASTTLQGVNKYINSRYNTPQGSTGKPLEGNNKC